MDDLDNDLREECHLLAQRARDTRFPHWSPQEMEEWANSYYLIAEDYIGKVREYPEDPTLVLRVLRYLGRQDIPTHHVLWLSENLRTLVRLACPPHGSDGGQEPLFHDLCRGMTRANELGLDEARDAAYDALEIVTEWVEVPGVAGARSS